MHRDNKAQSTRKSTPSALRASYAGLANGHGQHAGSDFEAIRQPAKTARSEVIASDARLPEQALLFAGGSRA